MRLYALCDQEMLESKSISLNTFLQIAKAKNAEIIQYRNKNAHLAEIKKQLLYLRNNFDGFLIINDAYELASFCDGVHIGQEDLTTIDTNKSKAVKILKEVIGKDKIIGISTHNKEEILETNGMDINYIGLGAYRGTSTKKDVTHILGESLDALAKLSTHPVAAIGGVQESDTFENVTYHVIGSGLFV
jgi:thiamine-phosphate pyrophosphorylase